MEDETKKLVNLFNAPAQTEDDIMERQAQQQFDAEEMKIGMLPPEQQALYRQQRMAELMAAGRPQQMPSDPARDKLLQQKAMQHYNSPEAQATRARFDSSEPRQDLNLAEAAGLIKPEEQKYRRIRKFLRK